MACFDNKDYKDMRMNSDDFLKERGSDAPDLMEVIIKLDLCLAFLFVFKLASQVTTRAISYPELSFLSARASDFRKFRLKIDFDYLKMQ